MKKQHKIFFAQKKTNGSAVVVVVAEKVRISQNML